MYWSGAKTEVLEGTWECTGRIRITDPCYEKDVADRNSRLAGVVDAAPGAWKAGIRSSRWARVATLLAWSVSATDPAESDDWEAVDFRAGVDSGGCGVFNEASYPEGPSTGEYDDPGSFYGAACRATDTGAGLVRLGDAPPVGVASRSGHGDGAYTVRVRRRGGVATAVRVTFLGSEAPSSDDD